MHIRIANNADQEAWDAYVLNHPKGLAYHLFAWRTAVENSYGHEGVYLIAENPQHAVCGVLPLVNFALPFGSFSYVSLPYCDAAGPLADNKDISQALLAYAEKIAQSKGTVCHIRQAGELDGNTTSSTTEKVRMLLPLPSTAAELLAGFKAKLRSQVRKPERDGLTFKTGGVELVPEFYQVFVKNMRDLGSPVHSENWILNVVKFFERNALLSVVYTPDQKPAAAGMILLHKTTVSIPWASSLREFNRLNPNMLLYWSFLSYAADNGYKFFDFGRSTPGEGTYRFKEQWGAQPQPLDWYELPASEKQVVSPPLSSKRQLVEKVWQKFPVGVTTLLGPRIRKYISL